LERLKNFLRAENERKLQQWRNSIAALDTVAVPKITVAPEPEPVVNEVAAKPIQDEVKPEHYSVENYDSMKILLSPESAGAWQDTYGGVPWADESPEGQEYLSLFRRLSPARVEDLERREAELRVQAAEAKAEGAFVDAIPWSDVATGRAAESVLEAQGEETGWFNVLKTSLGLGAAKTFRQETLEEQYPGIGQNSQPAMSRFMRQLQNMGIEPSEVISFGIDPTNRAVGVKRQQTLHNKAAVERHQRLLEFKAKNGRIPTPAEYRAAIAAPAMEEAFKFMMTVDEAAAATPGLMMVDTDPDATEAWLREENPLRRLVYANTYQTNGVMRVGSKVYQQRYGYAPGSKSGGLQYMTNLISVMYDPFAAGASAGTWVEDAASADSVWAGKRFVGPTLDSYDVLSAFAPNPADYGDKTQKEHDLMMLIQTDPKEAYKIVAKAVEEGEISGESWAKALARRSTAALGGEVLAAKSPEAAIYDWWAWAGMMPEWDTGFPFSLGAEEGETGAQALDAIRRGEDPITQHRKLGAILAESAFESRVGEYLGETYFAPGQTLRSVAEGVATPFRHALGEDTTLEQLAGYGITLPAVLFEFDALFGAAAFTAGATGMFGVGLDALKASRLAKLDDVIDAAFKGSDYSSESYTAARAELRRAQEARDALMREATPDAAAVKTAEDALGKAQQEVDAQAGALGAMLGEEWAGQAQRVLDAQQDLLDKQDSLAALKETKGGPDAVKAAGDAVQAAKAELETQNKRMEAVRKKSEAGAKSPDRFDKPFEAVTGTNLEQPMRAAENHLTAKYFYESPQVKEIITNKLETLTREERRLDDLIADMELEKYGEQAKLDLMQASVDKREKAAEKWDASIAEAHKERQGLEALREAFDMRVHIDTMLNRAEFDTEAGRVLKARLNAASSGSLEDMRAVVTDIKKEFGLNDVTDETFKAAQDAASEARKALAGFDDLIAAYGDAANSRRVALAQAYADSEAATDLAFKATKEHKDAVDAALKANPDLLATVDESARNAAVLDPEFWRKIITTYGDARTVDAARAAQKSAHMRRTMLRKQLKAQENLDALRAPKSKATGVDVDDAQFADMLAKNKLFQEKHNGLMQQVNDRALKNIVEYVEARLNARGELGASKVAQPHKLAEAALRERWMFTEAVADLAADPDYVDLVRAHGAARVRAQAELANGLKDAVSRAKTETKTDFSAETADILARAVSGRFVDATGIGQPVTKIDVAKLKEQLRGIDPEGALRQNAAEATKATLQNVLSDVDPSGLKTLQPREVADLRVAIDKLLHAKYSPTEEASFVTAKRLWHNRLDPKFKAAATAPRMARTTRFLAKTLQRIRNNPNALLTVSSRMNVVLKAFIQRNSIAEDDIARLSTEIDWDSVESFQQVTDSFLLSSAPVNTRWGATLTNGGDDTLMDLFVERLVSLAEQDKIRRATQTQDDAWQGYMDEMSDVVALSRALINRTTGRAGEGLTDLDVPLVRNLLKKFERADDGTVPRVTTVWRAAKDDEKGLLELVHEATQETFMAAGSELSKKGEAPPSLDYALNPKMLDDVVFAVTHGALRRQVADQYAHSMMGMFDDEAVDAVRSLMEGKTLSPQAMKKAMRVIDELELDLSDLAGGPGAAEKTSDRLAPILNEIAQLDASLEGRIFAPKPLLDEANAIVRSRIRSLASMAPRSRSEFVAAVFEKVSNTVVGFYRALVIGLIAGHGIIKGRRLWANMPAQNVSQILVHEGLGTTTRVAFKSSLAHFAPFLPYKPYRMLTRLHRTGRTEQLEKAIEAQVAVFQQKLRRYFKARDYGDSTQVPDGYLTRSLLPGRTARLFAGDVGVFTTKDGRTFTYDQLRKYAIDYAIFSGTLRGNLGKIISSRHLNARASRARRFISSALDWNQTWILHGIETAEVRWRMELFLDLLDNGAPLEAAAQRTIKATYDFSGPMAQLELNSIERMIPFWNVRWNMLKDAANSTTEFLRGNRNPEYFTKALTGNTRLGRIRRQERVLKSMRQFSDKDERREGSQTGDPSQSVTEWGQYHKTALAPVWVKPTQLVVPRIISQEKAAEYSETLGRDVDQVTVVGPHLSQLQGMDELLSGALFALQSSVVMLDVTLNGEERTKRLASNWPERVLDTFIVNYLPVGAKDVVEVFGSALSGTLDDAQYATPGEAEFYRALGIGQEVPGEDGTDQLAVKRALRGMGRIFPYGVHQARAYVKAYAETTNMSDPEYKRLLDAFIQESGVHREYYDNRAALQERGAKEFIRAYESVDRSLK
jgi:hypothetical protein